MIKKIRIDYFFILIIIVWGLFSFPVLIGKTPFPSNYQTNFFTPWVDYPEYKGPVKNNAQPDIVGQIYPWRYYSIQELKSGRIPFWNPYNFSGTPHLANYQSAVLFPLNILFFLPLSFIDSWSILVILQPLLAGILMFLLLKEYKLSSLSSSFGAISFMFCGFLVTWMGYATLGYAILPLPIALFFVLRYLKSKNNWILFFLSLTIPFSFFAGHFQTSLYFLIALIFFVVYQFIIKSDRKGLINISLFIASGVLLTMPQVLPTIEFYTNSARSEIFGKIESIPLNYISTIIAPDFFGHPVTRNDWYGHYAEWSAYAGSIAFIVSLYTVIFYRNKKTYFFILLGLVSALLAFSTPLGDILVNLKIPVLSTSAQSRIIVLFSFSTAVLFAFGIDQIKNEKNLGRIIKWMIVSVVLAILIFLAGATALNNPEYIKIAVRNSALPALFILISCLIILISKILKGRFQKIAFIVLLLVCLFEMFRFASKWQNFDPKSNAFTNTSVTNFLSGKKMHERVIGFSSADVSVYYRLPVLGGYDPLYKDEYGIFTKFVQDGRLEKSDRSAVTIPYRGKYSEEAINFLGVRYIVHKKTDKTHPWAYPIAAHQGLKKIFNDQKFEIYENAKGFPRSFIVSDVSTPFDRQQTLNFMFENDLLTKAITNETVTNIDKNATGSAKILVYNPDYVQIEAESTGTGFLVLTDNYYPGWKAYVNKKPEKIYKTNFSFRGIVIPEGNNIVEFKFVPKSFYYGVYLAGIGLIIIISFIILSKIKKEKWTN